MSGFEVWTRSRPLLNDGAYPKECANITTPLFEGAEVLEFIGEAVTLDEARTIAEETGIAPIGVLQHAVDEIPTFLGVFIRPT